MDSLSELDRARAEFERRLLLVTDGQWDSATPCGDWTARDVVNHIVAGNRMAARLLHGASAHDSLDGLLQDVLGDDPVAAFRSSAAEQAAAFAEPDALARTVHHAAGDMSARTLLFFRTADYTVHAWDLARGLGADETLDAGLAEALWREMEPLAPVLAASGFFGTGPSGDLPADASIQTRLLDASGRRP